MTVLNPSNKPTSLRVDATGRLLVASIGGGSGGAVVTTEAAIAALEAAGTMVPGLYIDENELVWVATSGSHRFPLEDSGYIGTTTYPTMIATPSPVVGMWARVPFLNRHMTFEYGYGADAGAGPVLGWWPRGDQVVYNSALRNFGVVTATARQICSVPIPMKSLCDGVRLGCDWAVRKAGGVAENMVLHWQLSNLPSTYDASKDFQTAIMNTTGIVNTGRAEYAILTADTVFGRWGGGVIANAGGVTQGSSTSTVTPLTTPNLRTTDMFLNVWAISTAAVESLLVDQLRFKLAA